MPPTSIAGILYKCLTCSKFFVAVNFIDKDMNEKIYENLVILNSFVVLTYAIVLN